MLSGRLINDQFSDFVEDEIKNRINSKKIKKILILGVSYKANVADLKNSLALKIYLRLKKKFKNKIFAFDTVIDKNSARKFNIYQKISKINNYDLIVPLVNHTDLKNRFLDNYVLKKIDT